MYCAPRATPLNSQTPDFDISSMLRQIPQSDTVIRGKPTCSRVGGPQDRSRVGGPKDRSRSAVARLEEVIDLGRAGTARQICCASCRDHRSCSDCASRQSARPDFGSQAMRFGRLGLASKEGGHLRGLNDVAAPRAVRFACRRQNMRPWSLAPGSASSESCAFRFRRFTSTLLAAHEGVTCD